MTPMTPGASVVQQARALRAAGRAGEAVELLGRALDATPGDPDAVVEFISAATDAGQPALAYDRLVRYTRAQPFAIDMLRLDLQLAISLQRWPEAAFALEKLIVLESNEALVAKLRPHLARVRRQLNPAGTARRRGHPFIPRGRPRILLATLSSPPSICSFYERAFRRAADVVTFGPMRDAASWQQYGENLKAHAFYRPGSAESWVEVCVARTRACDIVTPPAFVDLAEILAELPSGFTPDLFVWVDQDRFTLPVNLDALPCPSVALMGDTHIDLEWRLRYAAGFDHVFVMFNRQHMSHFSAAGCPSVHWCPAAIDPEVHVPPVVPRAHDVGFVGSTHPELHRRRVERLRALIAQGIDVYVDSQPLERMSQVLAASRICLNDTAADDLNMRVFEALGAGTLLLTNRLPPESGLETLFADGRHLVTYGDDADLLEKIRYYLDDRHAAEREAIAADGQREVIARHTYDARVAEILTTVNAER